MRIVLLLLALSLTFWASNAADCSITASEYSTGGCSAANFVACSQFNVTEGACQAVPSQSSGAVYVQVSNCTDGTYSVFIDNTCSTPATLTSGCTPSAPFFSFDVSALGAAPYCANTNITCRAQVVSYNNLGCTQYLRCSNTFRGSSGKDGVCVYEPRIGLYVLPHCQTNELVISNQASCSGGLTRTFQTNNWNVTGPGTCSPFGNNVTTFAVYFPPVGVQDLGCSSASSVVSWLSFWASSFVF